jgi:hypothetical protein
MYFSLGDVVIVLLLGGLGLYFFMGVRVRELAIDAVKRAARDTDFQLLDQTVALQRVSLSRDDSRRWRIWRQYRFEYSYDGVRRQQGHVIMLGNRLKALVVAEPDRILH